MDTPSHLVLDVAAVRAVERAAIGVHGIPEAELMQRAGRAAFEALRARWPDARSIAVVCGPGNNGGDGRVVAALAEAAGMRVEVIEVGTSQLTELLPREGELLPREGGVEVIVDALFGIGLSRAPDGAAAECITAMNAHPAPVLALDVPSGLDADSGRVDGSAVEAAMTVTFIAYKRGLFNADGPRHAGRVVCDGLGVPAKAYESITPVAAVLPTGLAFARLGVRPRDAHKGTSGHVLVIGGQSGMCGAALLAGEAAGRCGAGLVSLAVAPGAARGRDELMIKEVENAESLAPLIERANVIAIGPGLGHADWAQKMFQAALDAGKPLVVDADALALLKDSGVRNGDWVLTPHPGEAAQLLGVTSKDIQADRYGALAELVGAYGGTVVLKGAATLVGDGAARMQVCAAGNPGMASGGMGDVLTGVIAAFRAQRLPRFEAACAGVQVHAEAGDAAVEGAGERGLLAGDLMRPLQRLVNGMTP